MPSDIQGRFEAQPSCSAASLYHLLGQLGIEFLGERVEEVKA